MMEGSLRGRRLTFCHHARNFRHPGFIRHHRMGCKETRLHETGKTEKFNRLYVRKNLTVGLNAWRFFLFNINSTLTKKPRRIVEATISAYFLSSAAVIS